MDFTCEQISYSLIGTEIGFASVHIIDDDMLEGVKMFHAFLLPDGTPTSNIILDPDMARAQIIDNDGNYA